MTIDIKDWGFWGVVVGIIALYYSRSDNIVNKINYWQTQIHEDVELRREVAAKLRNSTLGGIYRDSLQKALDWLDRVFGRPNSLRALGVCILVALVYSYFMFVLGWTLGGSGEIGGIELLPKGLRLVKRTFFGIVFAFAPLLIFVCSCWVTRFTSNKGDRFKTFLHAQLNRHNFGIPINILYLFITTILVFVFFTCLNTANYIEPINIGLLGLLALPILGAYTGYYLIIRFHNLRPKYLIVFIIGFIVPFLWRLITEGAGEGAFNTMPKINLTGVPLLLLTSIIFSLSGIRRIAGGIIGTILGVFLTVLIAGFLTLIIIFDAYFYGYSLALMFGEKTPTVSISGALVLIFLLTSGAGVLLGSIRQNSMNSYLLMAGYTGSIFYFITTFNQGLGSSNLGVNRLSFSLMFSLFLFVLPITNAIFDWLSWWATRALGNQLQGILLSNSDSWRKTLAIAGHGIVDLVVGLLLLLSMAYFLAFGIETYNEFIKLQNQQIAMAGLREMIETTALQPFKEGFWILSMLLTTLIPTFGHGIMLLGSPLGLVFLPDSKRLELADELDNYNSVIEKQVTVRRKAATWIVRGQMLTYLVALFLFVWLLVRLGVVLYYQGSLTKLIANTAYFGIGTAEWLGRLFF